MVDTPVVANYDSDILLPLESYINATNMISKGWVHPDAEGGEPVKVIYPYGYGNYQMQCHVGDNEVTNFINSGFNFEYFNGHMRQWDAKYGFCQFFDTEEYKRLGGENENFIAYGYEDDERHYRFNLLSSVGRIHEYVYHLEHGRTKNSWFNNPYCEDNKKMWESLKVKGKDKLLKYYEEVDYVKTRNG
jgi:predicted glycosyltransferase involved in capsule biosynthesis